MTTGPKKSVYYYYTLIVSLLMLYPMVICVADLKGWIVNGTFFSISEMINHIPALLVFCVTFYFIGEFTRYGEGYTTVITTEYNLYKCKEKGSDESFMMFADSVEELEQFFEITEPDKTFMIEPAEITGKSIKMKVYS